MTKPSRTKATSPAASCAEQSPFQGRFYDGQSLIADPIHNYIPFTVPFGQSDEKTEKDLIDTKWMQRLRYINQLQSARWVYPSAEHSRFVHSLGAMHVAGRFAKHLYPSLKDVAPETPSAPLVESLLRVSVLLHDIGHGPFCHFFDHHFLDAFDLSHEKLGQEIIRQKLGPLIRKIRRSPGGSFSPGERLDPEHVAFLIHKDKSYQTPRHFPRWLSLLKPLFSGIFTADNLDYVLRDAYMCGIATGPVDLNRLIHYTFFTKQGLTLHRSGLSTLTMFLNARAYLYSNLYYHRTTRALDLHMKDIFRVTLSEIFPQNPLNTLEAYAELTDWSLLLEVKSWGTAKKEKRRRLFKEWNTLWSREIKWKMAYETVLPLAEEGTEAALETEGLESKIRIFLPPNLKTLAFRVDIASKAQRPSDPLSMGPQQIYTYNPSTGLVSKEALRESVDTIPAKLSLCRIYTLSHTHDAALSEAAEQALTRSPRDSAH